MKIQVADWLPEGTSNEWSVERTIITEESDYWVGNDLPASDLLSPNIVYTALYRKLESGVKQRPMMDEPREIEEARPFVERASGSILVTGLGIGMVPVWLSQKDNVTRIDVIEKSLDVIKLVAPYLPSPKIQVIHADAYLYVPGMRYNFAWHDCWYEVPANVKELLDHYALFVEYQEFWEPRETAGTYL